MGEPEPAISRYQRQELLAHIGARGQALLADSSAVIVGSGATGGAAAELLARAGVGTIRIIDRDVVEMTNLQRQPLFDEADAREGTPKAVAAGRRLRAINACVRIEPIVGDVFQRNAERFILGAEGGRSRRPGVIVDGTDNFETRYLLNDLAVRDGIPLVYGGAVGAEGRTMSILPDLPGAPWGDEYSTPCLRCVFPEPPAAGSAAATATCDTVGVLGPVTAIVGALQAAESIKILLGDWEHVSRDLTNLEIWSGSFGRVSLVGARRGAESDDPCPCCASREFPFLDGLRGGDSLSLCGRDAVQVRPAASQPVEGIDLAALRGRLTPHGAFSDSGFMVRGSLRGELGEHGRPLGLTVFRDGRAIISGTVEIDRARSIYAKYVGA